MSVQTSRWNATGTSGPAGIPGFTLGTCGNPPVMEGDLPDGLVYQPELITAAEEDAVIELLEKLGFSTVEMRGQVARRTVHHFGFHYDYASRNLAPADPIPEPLEAIRSRAEQLAGLEPGSFVQLLAQRYPPGAPIGWHRDSTPFGVIAGISLKAPSRMRLRRGEGGRREVRELVLEPRSGYVLAGEARTAWQHQIPPVKELRYSLTFRSLRRPERWAQPAARPETSERTAATASGSSE